MTTRLLRASLKVKIQSGHLPVWVAVHHPILANIELRKVLTWVPKPRLSDKEIDWLVEKDMQSWNPKCGDLSRRQIQMLYLALPPRAKYPEPKET